MARIYLSSTYADLKAHREAAYRTLRQLHCKFGELPETVRQQVEAADPETLLTWSERILTAQSIDEVLH